MRFLVAAPSGGCHGGLAHRAAVPEAPAVAGFALFLLLVAALGAAAYLGLFMTHVPGAADERLGQLEPLPDDLNQWVEGPEPSPEGWIVERRTLQDEQHALRLILQTRYRDPDTRDIVKVDPELTTRRRRIKQR